MTREANRPGATDLTNRLRGPRRTRIGILGGGFGGLYTALGIEKTLARDPQVEVVLVHRDNFFLFTPLLHEVAASDIDLTNIVSPFRKLLRRVRFTAGEIEQIDLPNKRVVISHGHLKHRHSLEFDHLVIALGSVTNFHDLPGLESSALTMRSLGDAVSVRTQLIAQLEEADFECSAKTRQELLTFVVAGAGFAGVETVAAINDFVREAIRSYFNLRADSLRVVLVHSGPVILPELPEALGIYAGKELARRGVEIRVNSKVSGVSAGNVELAGGTGIKSRMVIWAGNAPHSLLRTLPCRKELGRILVDDHLEIPGWPGVWAVGDCAYVVDPKTGLGCPPTAQHALQEGAVAARNIAAAVFGRRKKPFRYSSVGQLAAIGRRSGVASIGGVKFAGFPAWWLWRTIYLTKLPRFEKRLRVALDWTLDLFFPKDLVQHMTVSSRSLPQEKHDP